MTYNCPTCNSELLASFSLRTDYGSMHYVNKTDDGMLEPVSSDERPYTVSGVLCLDCGCVFDL